MQADIITDSMGFQKVKITTDKGLELFFRHLTGENYNFVNGNEEIGFIIPDGYSYRDEESSFKKLFGFWWFFNGDSRDIISSVKAFFNNPEHVGLLKTIKDNNLRIQRETKEREIREALEREKAEFEAREAERKNKYISDREEASKEALKAAKEATEKREAIEAQRIKALEKQENEAATKIQASWKGFKSQKEFKALRDATIKIQSVWKGFKVRKELEEQNEAATKIQSSWKGFKAQQEFKALRDATIKIQSTWKGYKSRKELEEQNEAATKIQANWRMLKAQKELKALRDAKEEAERKLAIDEERRLEELKLQMQREAKELQEARAAQDAKRQKELEDREAVNAARLKEEKEALIASRKAKAEELKAKLALNVVSSASAEATVEDAIEKQKPEPVKVMEAKFFICEIQHGRKLVMQYSSESSDGSEGSKGMPDHIELVNSDKGFYKLGPGSFLNGQPIENIEINYPSHKGSALRVLPSDIKGYGEIAPNLDMFYLALLCWNPRKINTEVFSVDHFDLDGFHYRGNEQFEHNSGMWKFESTMDNGFVGEALSALESDFPG